MSTLAEFLKEHGEKLRAGAPERAKRREEWVAAVERLVQQIEGWLRQADGEQVLQVERIAVERQEPQLGAYLAPALNIALGGERVQVLPGPRYVLAPNSDEALTRGKSQGRVDVTDGAQTYHLYRYANDQGEWWALVDDEEYVPRRFDQKSFEDALVQLLQ